MSAIMFTLEVVIGIILVISYAQFSDVWANQACYYVNPLCGYPTLLIIAGIFLIGMHLVIRA